MTGQTAGRWHTAVPIVLLLLSLIATREWLERSMALHMLVQIPLLVLAGAWRARSRPGMFAWLQSFNPAGIPGLLLATTTIAVWMIPRALDAAVETWHVDAVKYASLLGAGAVGVASWHVAGTVVRLFVLGNAVWMTATVGMLLLDAPNRVCVSYGANDQELAGYGLVFLSLFVVVAALVRGSAASSQHTTSEPVGNEHAATPVAT